MTWIRAGDSASLGLGVVLVGPRCYAIPDAYGVNEAGQLVEINVTSARIQGGARTSNTVGGSILRYRVQGPFRVVKGDQTSSLPMLHLDLELGWVDAHGCPVDNVPAIVLTHRIAEATSRAADADGRVYEYRMVSSRLERRIEPRTLFDDSVLWEPVMGDDFLRMTSTELRTVADVLDTCR